MNTMRLYTLFIIIGLMFSSAIKAEENQSPEFNTTGGRYVRVENASDITDGGVYLITSIEKPSTEYNLYALSTANTSVEGRFIPAFVEKTTSNESYPDVIQVQTVNSDENPYEYVFEKGDTKRWRIKGKEGYLKNNISTATAMSFINDTSDKGTMFLMTSRDDYPWQICLENTNSSSKKGYIGSNSTNKGAYFSCFNSLSPKYVVLYKKVSSGGGDTPTSEPFSMSNVGYATMYYETKDVTLPTGLQAYTYTLRESGSKVYLSESHAYNAGDKVPAGVAVVVKGAEGNYTLTLTSPDENLEKYPNVLRGTETDKLLEEADCTFYMLSLNKDNDVNSIGFYWGAENGAAFTNKAHKAYLALPNSLSAKSIVISLNGLSVENETTKVEQNSMKANAAEMYYDALGRKIRNGGNTLRIAKGKKFVSR